MYQEISKLLMYGDLSQDEILYKLGQLFEQFEVGEYNKTELVRDINTQVKRILKVATDYGFDDNLWHNYLTFFLMMSENPFSITCEKVGASDGSVNGLVANDFRIFKKLFDYDFVFIRFLTFSRSFSVSTATVSESTSINCTLYPFSINLKISISSTASTFAFPYFLP